MTTEHVRVSFGGKVTHAEIVQFESLDEARAALGDDAMLALINAGYRSGRLREERQALEHHPRKLR